MIQPELNNLLQVTGLKKYFPLKKAALFRWEDQRQIRAVDGIDFDIYQGETLALVGESGSGKSTIGRLVLRLIRATEGSVIYKDKNIFHLSEKATRKLRRNMQIVLQDPSGALNPRMTIKQILEEPFLCHNMGDQQTRLSEVKKLLEIVGLNSSFMNRRPHELSGGQKQRVCIGRALALKPEFVVCDEPISALDASYQAQIVNLLSDLQQQLGLTYLFISHDLRIVKHMANRVAVLYLGKIVEMSDVDSLFKTPLHPYTQALIASSPSLHADKRQHHAPLEGELPDPSAPPSGCNFRTRCPLAEEVCSQVEPRFMEGTTRHGVACHVVNRSRNISI